MIKNVYYEGKFIPVKNWDFERKRPKIKVKKAEVIAESETQAEVIAVEEATE